MRKIILILVFGFSLNTFVFAGEVTTIDGQKVYTDSSGEQHIISKEDISNAKKQVLLENGTNDDGKRYVKDSNGNMVEGNTSSSASGGGNGIEVKVTEKIPGANCDGSPGAYTCTIKPGFGTVMLIMGGIIKYFTFLASLGGVLFIVINGLMLSMGGFGGSKDEIKKRITMTIGGLILLLLSGLILHSIAPWIYQ